MATITGRRDDAIDAQTSLLRDVKSDSIHRRTRVTDAIVRVIMTSAGLFSIFTTLGIVYILASETSLFLSQSAYVNASAPIPGDATLVLTEDVDAGETSITFTTDITQALFDDQYLLIDDEIMQVLNRNRDTVTVDRGSLGTIPTTHQAEDTDVIVMVRAQVRPAEPLDTEQTRIPIRSDFTRVFEVGDVVRLGVELMRVEDIGAESITVTRGFDESTVTEHGLDVSFETQTQPTVGEFLTSTTWAPPNEFGVWPLVSATLLITAIAMLVAVPLGLGAAIYLSEYASPQVRSILKPILEILAGIPTVVFGFFALQFMSPFLQGIFGEQVQFQNVLSAGLVVGILLIPYISSFSEDALRAVPMALREASYGMGATKLETTARVVVPAAFSGISAAFILAASRAIGETMIVALAAGSLPRMPESIFGGAETMTGYIARISKSDIPRSDIRYASIFAIGATLFVITFFLNILSNWIRSRFQEEY